MKKSESNKSSRESWSFSYAISWSTSLFEAFKVIFEFWQRMTMHCCCCCCHYLQSLPPCVRPCSTRLGHRAVRRVAMTFWRISPLVRIVFVWGHWHQWPCSVRLRPCWLPWWFVVAKYRRESEWSKRKEWQECSVVTSVRRTDVRDRRTWPTANGIAKGGGATFSPTTFPTKCELSH